jgi:hypothetical protein
MIAATIAGMASTATTNHFTTKATWGRGFFMGRSRCVKCTIEQVLTYCGNNIFVIYTTVIWQADRASTMTQRKCLVPRVVSIGFERNHREA